MPLLKAALHCHTREEPKENLKYNARELLDRAAKLHFDVAAFTCHNFFFFPKEIQEYAAKKNILLIPGIERSIKRRHVLILNATPDAEKIRTFEKLREYRSKNNCLIIAPHPFYRTYHCLKKKLIEHLDLFDAIEFSFFYSLKTNWNKKAIKTAKKYKKPLIGTSDVHFLEYFDTTYSLIEAEKNISSIFQAIRKNRIAIKTEPLKKGEMSKIFFKMSGNHLRRIGKKIWHIDKNANFMLK